MFTKLARELQTTMLCATTATRSTTSKGSQGTVHLQPASMPSGPPQTAVAAAEGQAAEAAQQAQQLPTVLLLPAGANDAAGATTSSHTNPFQLLDDHLFSRIWRAIRSPHSCVAFMATCKLARELGSRQIACLDVTFDDGPVQQAKGAKGSAKASAVMSPMALQLSRYPRAATVIKLRVHGGNVQTDCTQIAHAQRTTAKLNELFGPSSAQRLAEVTTLYFAFCALSPSALQPIVHCCPRLRSLRLQLGSLTPDSFRLIAQLPSLEELDLCGDIIAAETIPADCLQPLRQLAPTLRHMRIRRVSGKRLLDGSQRSASAGPAWGNAIDLHLDYNSTVQYLPNLNTLQLTDMKEPLSPAAITAVVPTLRSLEINNLGSIPAEVQPLVQCTALTRLEITARPGITIPEPLFRVLLQIPHLREVSSPGISFDCQAINDEPQLSHMACTWQRLRLTGEAQPAMLARLPLRSLEMLSISAISLEGASEADVEAAAQNLAASPAAARSMPMKLRAGYCTPERLVSLMQAVRPLAALFSNVSLILGKLGLQELRSGPFEACHIQAVAHAIPHADAIWMERCALATPDALVPLARGLHKLGQLSLSNVAGVSVEGIGGFGTAARAAGCHNLMVYINCDTLTDDGQMQQARDALAQQGHRLV